MHFGQNSPENAAFGGFFAVFLVFFEVFGWIAQIRRVFGVRFWHRLHSPGRSAVHQTILADLCGQKAIKNKGFAFFPQCAIIQGFAQNSCALLIATP
jgi:hypothetical protein